MSKEKEVCKKCGEEEVYDKKGLCIDCLLDQEWKKQVNSMSPGGPVL